MKVKELRKILDLHNDTHNILIKDEVGRIYTIENPIDNHNNDVVIILSEVKDFKKLEEPAYIRKEKERILQLVKKIEKHGRAI